MAILPPELQLRVARALTAAGGENAARPVARIWREAANDTPLGPRALYRYVGALGDGWREMPPPSVRERARRSAAAIGDVGSWRADLCDEDIGCGFIVACGWGELVLVQALAPSMAGNFATEGLRAALENNRADVAIWLAEDLARQGVSMWWNTPGAATILDFCKWAPPPVAARYCRAIPRAFLPEVLRAIYAEAGAWGAAWARPFVAGFGFGLELGCEFDVERLMVKTQMLAAACAAGDGELARWLAAADAPGPPVTRADWAAHAGDDALAAVRENAPELVPWVIDAFGRRPEPRGKMARS